MRTLAVPLTAMLATRNHYRARCLRVRLRDGTLIGITDHDRRLLVDLPQDSDVPLTFVPDTGIMPSDISLASGLDADNFEVSGPLDALITKTAVLGRRFQGATVWLFDADSRADLPDVLPLMKGHIGEAKVQGGRFVFEVRSAADLYNTVVGELMTPYCRADYGDTKCGVGVPAIAATVTAVSSDFQFEVNLGGVYADGHFRLGTVEFLTGALAGTEVIEIFNYDGTDAAIELLVPCAERPTIGDTLTVKIGCSKVRLSDDPTIPTCLTNANVDRFRGFHAVPGSDVYVRTPIPGNPEA